MTEFYDDLETRNPEEREEKLLSALPMQVALAKNTNGYSKIFSDIDPKTVNSRDALATLPITRKAELMNLQSPDAPFGGLNYTPLDRLARVYLSPGPVAEPQGRNTDFWRIRKLIPVHSQ